MDSPVGEIAERWDYVFCDEFPDRLQFDLVTSLVTDENLFVVGDDDRTIYEWRGANVANITDELDQAFAALTDERWRRTSAPVSRFSISERGNSNSVTESGTRRSPASTNPRTTGDSVATVELPDEDDDSDGAAQLRTVVQNLLTGAAENLDGTYDPGDIALLSSEARPRDTCHRRIRRRWHPVYQVAGDLATESVGVGTVTAYLKALARPKTGELESHPPLMRYRLCDADLSTLNAGDDPLVDTLRRHHSTSSRNRPCRRSPRARHGTA